MLDDMLIEGTSGDMPPEEEIAISAGPRVYAVKVKQGDEDIPTKPAICFIGHPIWQEIIDNMLERDKLSSNYSYVFIPCSILRGIDPRKSRGIAGDSAGCFVVRGLMPTPNLKLEMISLGRLKGDENEGIVYAAPEDFVDLNL
jgi:hypothetical protein